MSDSIKVGRLTLTRVAPRWLWFGHIDEDLPGGRSRSTRVKVHELAGGGWSAGVWVDVFGDGMAVNSAGVRGVGDSAELAIRGALRSIAEGAKSAGLPELEVTL